MVFTDSLQVNPEFKDNTTAPRGEVSVSGQHMQLEKPQASQNSVHAANSLRNSPVFAVSEGYVGGNSFPVQLLSLLSPPFCYATPQVVSHFKCLHAHARKQANPSHIVMHMPSFRHTGGFLHNV